MTKRTAQTETRSQFDQGLIEEILEFNGGALYARTAPLKSGRNIMTYSTMTWDWHVLYDCKYNDTDKHWGALEVLWSRMQTEKGLSTRRKKVTQKLWDSLEEKWKKEQQKQKRAAARADKKIAAEMEKRREEEKLLAEQRAEQSKKEREEREAEFARLEAEEEKAKKKKTRKPRKTTKSKAKPKTKPKTTKPTTRSSSKKTKWRDMKAKMEEDTLDQFM
jgi:hypothetical protein